MYVTIFSVCTIFIHYICLPLCMYVCNNMCTMACLALAVTALNVLRKHFVYTVALGSRVLKGGVSMLQE